MRRKTHRCLTKNYLRLCVKDTPAALQPRYRTLVLKGAWRQPGILSNEETKSWRRKVISQDHLTGGTWTMTCSSHQGPALPPVGTQPPALGQWFSNSGYKRITQRAHGKSGSSGHTPQWFSFRNPGLGLRIPRSSLLGDSDVVKKHCYTAF